MSGYIWNYGILAPIGMSMLFEGSTRFTEWISVRKYPAYRTYQRRVAMFWFPLTIFLAGWHAFTGEKQAIDAKVWPQKSTETESGKKDL